VSAPTSLQAALSALRVELAHVRARAVRANAKSADGERLVDMAKQAATGVGILPSEQQQSERAAQAAVLRDMRAFVRDGRARPETGL